MGLYGDPDLGEQRVEHHHANDRAAERRRRQAAVNTQLSTYYNVVKPDFGADWQIRAQVQFMFPK